MPLAGRNTRRAGTVWLAVWVDSLACVHGEMHEELLAYALRTFDEF